MTPAERRERWFAIAFGLGLLSLLFVPLIRRADGFPLSNYPMFSRNRSTQADVFHVVAHSRVGEHRPVPPTLLGTVEIMQASQTAKVAAKNGPEAASELCIRVASAVADAGDDWADVDALELRKDRYDAVRYWQGERSPSSTKVFARCTVPRDEGDSR